MMANKTMSLCIIDWTFKKKQRQAIVLQCDLKKMGE
jgi:hypothetical protein